MSRMRIFVSHSSQDKAYADALVRALRRAGADVWYDEHNLGTGQLLDAITRELQARPVFIVLLSKAAFASTWVHDECAWAWNLSRREPQRIILPVVVAPIDHSDFNAMLLMEGFKRVEAPGNQPFPQAEAIERVLHELALTPAGKAPTAAAPLPGTDVESLVARGKALVAQQQYERALPFFQVATALAPDNFDAWANLGFAHNRLEQWQQALPVFDRVLAILPNNAVSWNSKGAVLSGLQRYQEALVAYDRALALDPNDTDAWNNKGNALNKLKHEEALVALARALARDSRTPRGWNLKATVLRALGRKTEAHEAERRAKELGG